MWRWYNGRQMWVVWPITLAAGGLLAGVVILIRRRSAAAGTVALIAAVTSLAVIWLTGQRLMAAGWHDVDGWSDCYRYCNSWHVLGALLFVGPFVVGCIVVLAVTADAVLGRRSRHHHPVS